MPSPVIGLTSPAASPASSTGPSGCCQRHADSGRWWPCQSRPPAVAPGSSVLELVEQQGLGQARAPRPTEQLAVPDVAEAVAAVEGPGVRRLRRRAVHDDLRAARGQRAWARSRGARRPAAPGRARASGDDGVGAVGADDDACVVPVVQPHPRRRVRRATSRTRSCRSTAPAAWPRVDQPVRRRLGRAGSPRHCGPSGRSTPEVSVGARLEPRDAAASRRPRVDARRRRAASTTCGAMPSPQDLSRGKSERSSSSTRRDGSTRSAPSAAAAPAGPAPTTTRSQVVTAVTTVSRRTSTRAIAIAARNGVRPARRTPRPPAPVTTTRAHPGPGVRSTGRSEDGDDRGGDEQHDRGQRLRTGAEPVRQAAHAGGGRRRQVGQRVEEVGGDPERGRGRHHPERRPVVRQVGEGDHGRQRPERHGVGQPRPGGALEPEVVEGPDGRRGPGAPARCASPPPATARRRRPPATLRQATTVDARSSPVASGLSVRPTCRSRPASTRSLPQPMVSWPANTAAVTTTPRSSGRSCPTANSATTVVTASVGPMWAARSRGSAGRLVPCVGMVVTASPGVVRLVGGGPPAHA